MRDLPDGPITVMCGHGERAMTGASLLERPAAGTSSVLAGGPDDWSAGTGTSCRPARPPPPTGGPPRLGLRENLGQFSLLVGVNALVGGMIGQERTVLPLLPSASSGSPRSPPRSPSSPPSAR